MHELLEESFAPDVTFVNRFRIILGCIHFEFLDLRLYRPQELQMDQPFTLILDIFGDQFAQVSVAIVDPLSGIHAWLDQNKRLIQEVEEFLHWTLWFLKQDRSLQLRAENHFIATDEAQVCEPYHIVFAIDQRHQLYLFCYFFWRAS